VELDGTWKPVVNSDRRVTAPHAFAEDA